MKAVEFLRKFFAIIFLIAFSILVLLMMLIGIAKSMVTEESISKYIVSSDIFNSPSNEVFGENNNNTLKQSISDKLLKMKISEEVTEKVLYSDEFNDVLTSYMYSYVNNVLFSTDRERLDNNKIIDIVQNNYMEVEGTNLSDEQLSMLNDYVSDLCLKVYDFTPDISELEGLGINVNVLKILSNICFSKYIWFVLGTFVLGAYTLIAICLLNKLKAFKWCSNMLVIDGIILVLFSFLEVKFLSMFINSRGIIDSLILTIANKSFENLLFYGIALMIVGIILLIICAVISKKERKENSDMLLNTVIEEEVSAKKALEDYKIRNNDELEKTLNDLDKAEIEKVLLDKLPSEELTDKVISSNDGEIPNIVIEGKDFEKTDIDNIKPNEDIFSENKSVLKKEEVEKVNSGLEKVLLDKLPSKEPTDKVRSLNDDEIPNIVIEGKDFEKKDIDNIKPNEDIFSENKSVLKKEEDKKVNSSLEKFSDDTELVEVEEVQEDEEKEEEEVKEFEIIETKQDDIEDVTISLDEEIDYEEINDEKEEKVVKRDVNVFPIEEVKLDIISPEKGKNIEFKDEVLKVDSKPDEEEIEVL
ncbi:MAG: hypothetical protein ACI31R_05760 [Bacilli bacterium]